MFLTLYCVIQEVSELVLPIAVNIVENIPWQKHPNSQPATNKKHEVVFVLARPLPLWLLLSLILLSPSQFVSSQYLPKLTTITKLKDGEKSDTELDWSVVYKSQVTSVKDKGLCLSMQYNYYNEIIFLRKFCLFRKI